MNRVERKYLDELLKDNEPPRTKLLFAEAHRSARVELFKTSIEAAPSDGLFIEFGVAGGKTTNEIATLMPDKILYGFDSFKGLPEQYTEEFGIGAFASSVPIVNDNVKLVIGMIEDTLVPFLDEHKEKISFLHMDVDVYSATNFILQTLVKRKVLQVGTVIQFDEIFEVLNGWWYQDEYLALENLRNYVTIEYLAWTGNCQCSYKVTKI
jgi:hypothetical protein